MHHPSSGFRGGQFIGQGSFGCTFSPPLRRGKGGGTLGKVLIESEADKEFRAVEKFLRIDPRGRYGVYGSSPQPLGSADVGESQEEVDKCDVEEVHEQLSLAKQAQDEGIPTFFAELKGMREIVMPKGKADMHKLLAVSQRALSPTKEEDATERSALDCALHLAMHLLAARNLMVGGAAYNAAGLYHLDIKAPNVVGFGPFDPLDTAESTYKFIDFGLSCTWSELAEDVARHDAPVTLRFWYPPTSPLEAAFTEATRTDGVRHFVVQTGIQAWFDAACAPPDAPATTTVSTWMPWMRVYQADVDAAVDQIRARGGDATTAAEARDLLLRQTDLFALGAVLKQLLSNCGVLVYDIGDGTTFAASGVHKGWEWSEQLASATLAPLAQLVFDMQHLRVSWHDLVARYDVVLDAFLRAAVKTFREAPGRSVLAHRRVQLALARAIDREKAPKGVRAQRRAQVPPVPAQQAVPAPAPAPAPMQPVPARQAVQPVHAPAPVQPVQPVPAPAPVQPVPALAPAPRPRNVALYGEAFVDIREEDVASVTDVSFGDTTAYHISAHEGKGLDWNVIRQAGGETRVFGAVTSAAKFAFWMGVKDADALKLFGWLQSMAK